MYLLTFNPITPTCSDDVHYIYYKLTEFKPELILLDINMPDMNGYELCKKIKADEKARDTIVIIITEYASKDLEKKSFNAGADEFLRKLIIIETLCGILDEINVK